MARLTELVLGLWMRVCLWVVSAIAIRPPIACVAQLLLKGCWRCPSASRWHLLWFTVDSTMVALRSPRRRGWGDRLQRVHKVDQLDGVIWKREACGYSLHYFYKCFLAITFQFARC